MTLSYVENDKDFLGNDKCDVGALEKLKNTSPIRFVSYFWVMTPLHELIVVGDRVLLKPLAPSAQTNGGLYLPPSVKEKDEVQSGTVVRVGPGYPILAQRDVDSFLSEESHEPVQYIPLQAKAGDRAIYLQKHAHELEIHGERYVIVNQNAILLLMRDELGLGELHT